jgi:hypothetical protein
MTRRVVFGNGEIGRRLVEHLFASGHDVSSRGLYLTRSPLSLARLISRKWLHRTMALAGKVKNHWCLPRPVEAQGAMRRRACEACSLG